MDATETKKKNDALINVANNFGDGMVAFLDTELDYIEFLRERNGGDTGVGGFGGQRGDQTQFDYAKTFGGYGDKKSSLNLRPRRLKPSKPRVKPRNRVRLGDKIKKFKNLRNSRNVTRSLSKLGLRGNQIDFYKNLRAKNIPMKDALKQAKRLNPGGNFIKNTFKYATDMIPNRPEFLTRLNMGGDLKHAGNNFFTRGLRPGNFSETAAAIKQSTVKNVDNLVSGAKTAITDTATNITKNVTKQLPLENVLARSTIEFSERAVKTGVTGLKAAKKLISPIVKRIPIIGALIDFALNFFVFKESLGRSAFKTAGSLIGAWGLGALGSAIPGFGNLVGAFIGGAAGDWLGGKLYDAVFAGNESEESVEEEGSTFEERYPDSGLITYAKGGVGYGAGGSVITAPTRGMFGGSRALVGEANEAEIILPMSKIGDAISAVYREGASIMVGATLAFLGPLAGGSPAAAGLLGEARRISNITGADTDIKVPKVEFPDMSGKPQTTNTTSSSTSISSSVTKETQTKEDNTTAGSIQTSVTGTDRWKTILPQGDPLFSSPFGPRWGKMHRGIDIGVWEDSPVHAQEDGVVEQILPKFGEYGGAVVISHQDGTANLYGHVYDYNVKKGQKVTKGDMLAKIQYYPGKDGSNQSHLHFERFNKSGTRIDPLPYFSQGGANKTVKETKMKSVNQGGPNLRNISSNFVNLGSQTKQNNQQLIDTPVNITNTSKGTSVQQIPIPSPYPVTVIKKEYVPVEDTMKESRMVIDVFGKGAGRR